MGFVQSSNCIFVSDIVSSPGTCPDLVGGGGKTDAQGPCRVNDEGYSKMSVETLGGEGSDVRRKSTDR